ncbi:MAG TPA: AmmeMemoRadiSam system protein A [Acidobacteriota bacterium]|nr:AmmeMemoRadiSam system protein A [Acidobacteriota bacterium]
MSRLTPEEGAELLQIAADALRLWIICNESYRGAPVHPALLEPGAAFVTLKKDRQLRGCIGRLIPSCPLFKAVADCAVAAATQDPRFDPITRQELTQCSLDVSVLSPLEVIEDTSLIEIGKHGVYVEKGGHRGVLLPQVAVELNLDRERFLDLTCGKAGLPADAWKHGATIKVFSTQVFHSEKI